MNDFLCKTQQQTESAVRLINGLIERKQCIHWLNTFQALGQGLLWMVAPSYQLCMPGRGPSGISNTHSLVWSRKGPGGRGIRVSPKSLFGRFTKASGGRQTSEDQHNLGSWEGGQWGGSHWVPTWLCHFLTAQKFTQRDVHPKRVEIHADILLKYWACGLWPSRREPFSKALLQRRIPFF